MNPIEAIEDPNLFRPFLADRDDDLHTWRNWFSALRLLYGIRVPAMMSGKRASLVSSLTCGRTEFPANGFNTALFLTGRRSGKSRVAAVVGAYEAILAGHETKLAPGERGIVAVCSPTKKQSAIVKNYLRAVFDSSTMLAGEVIAETKEGFDLRNGNQIAILAGDFKTVRGFTLLAAIIDEVAFFGIEEEAKIKSDTELIRAIKPALATVKGKLIAISSPYARKGWTWNTYKKNQDRGGGPTLVWQAPSKTMNPTLDQSIIDEALIEDYAAAKAEYLGEFRDDVGAYISRALVEAVVAPGRGNLLYRPGTRYHAFVDASGGRADSAVLCIAHREGRRIVVDFVHEIKAPHSPTTAIANFCEDLREYGLKVITGDNYAAEFVAKAYQANGIQYRKCELNKSELYAELLPRICSQEIELPDNLTLVDQLANLERRTHSGGKDRIDHPPNGGHDDVCNAVAGASYVAATGALRVGALA